MPSNWDEITLSRTLLIQRVGAPGNIRYRLHGFMRVTTRDGENYMEPLPSGEISLAHQGLTFTAVEFIEPPVSGQLLGGDTNLTRDANDMALRLTA
jgi:hypothetical protein